MRGSLGSAWILPGERMPVTAPSAPELRLGRIRSWLSGAGYTTASAPRTRLGGAPTSRGTAAAMATALGSLAAAPWVGLAARRRRPALLLANTVLHGPALAIVKRLLGPRVIVVVDVMGLHSLELAQTTRLSLSRALYAPLWRTLERIAIRSADLVLTVNDRHAELIAQLYGRDDAHALPDAAEVELTDTVPLPRGELGVPSGAVTVCFVGSLVCSRLDRILDAWGELARDRGRICLVVVGDGPDLRAYERRAAARGLLETHVFFVGPLSRERALAVARGCDIALSDCWSEAGLPLKLYEYMALGLPIVVEGKRQIRELLADGDNALFFDTPAELVRLLRRLADAPELRARMGRSARETFLARHTLTQRRRQFEALLSSAGGS